MIQIAHNLVISVQPIIGLVFHSSASEDVAHDGWLWHAMADECVEFEIDIFISCVGITVTAEGHWHAGCHKSSWTCAV